MKTSEHPFFTIKTGTGNSYGGDQGWLSKKFLKSYGCGIIGAADVILCIQGKKEISKSEYQKFAHHLWKRYLPVLPGFGINGIFLKMGMNRYFRKHKIPHRASWKISGKKLFLRIDEMLAKNLPVILSIGPNFPLIWGKQSVKFYVQKENGSYMAVSKARAHYVTVTGKNAEWIEISSWGSKYYINQQEYKEYVRRYSSFLVSNIICIQ